MWPGEPKARPKGYIISEPPGPRSPSAAMAVGFSTTGMDGADGAPAIVEPALSLGDAIVAHVESPARWTPKPERARYLASRSIRRSAAGNRAFAARAYPLPSCSVTWRRVKRPSRSSRLGPSSSPRMSELACSMLPGSRQAPPLTATGRVKIFADVDISPRVVEYLRQAGHDAEPGGPLGRVSARRLAA